MDSLIDQYLVRHPDFEYPVRGGHSVVLALTDQMNPWLVDRCGGVGWFWMLMVDAARSWFDLNEDSFELRYLRARIDEAGAMVTQALPRVCSTDNYHWQQRQLINEAWQEFLQWTSGGKKE